MKKFATILLAALLALSCACCFAACNKDNVGETVKLKYYSGGSEIIPLLASGEAEFAVLGEPAVTQATNKLKSQGKTLYELADLQQLWQQATGSSKAGYPQASLLVKKSLLQNEDFADALFQKLTDNLTYIKQNAADLSTLLQGAGSSLSVTFTEELIGRCNLVCINAYDEKSNIELYLQQFSAVSSLLPLDDSLFYTGLSDSSAMLPEGITCYAPDGAPAMAVANIIADGSVGGVSVTTTIAADGSEVQAKCTSGEADMAVLPTNAAVKIASVKDDYEIFTVNTYGLLYLVGTTQISDLSELAGKTVCSIGANNTPQLVFNKILDYKNIPHEESDD